MSDPKKYTVGWICAIRTEFVAAQAFLDETHEQPKEQDPNDSNNYALGRIAHHNVVIACLPGGEYGTASAAGVAINLLRSFPTIRIGLMVGIGGAAPTKKHDIRLGDVVISLPGNGRGGVFQYDYGKTIQGQAFVETGFLNQPPELLRTAVEAVAAKYELDGHNLVESVNKSLDKKPRLRKKYSCPTGKDILYKSDFIHCEDRLDGCEACGSDPSVVVLRPERGEDEDNPAIHYGLIASGNQLMKDALLREKLAIEKGILCFEMEAAGLMNRFPCLVIRGICDYADTHKNKEWQGFAAMTAAAYAKRLLSQIISTNIEAEKKVAEVLNSILESVSTNEETTKNMKSDLDKQKDVSILDWLTPIDYGPKQSDFIARWKTGTGHWFLDSEAFSSWLESSKQTLFCPGIPGAGKTILTSVVIDNLLTRFQDNTDIGIAYLYCDFRRQNDQQINHLLSSLLKQLAARVPVLPEVVRDTYNRHKLGRTTPSLKELSDSLRSVTAGYSRVFIVVDALDECSKSDGCRNRVLSELFRLQRQNGLNILATSRFIPEIANQFQGCSKTVEIRASSEDIERYFAAQICQLPPYIQQDVDLQNEIKQGISTSVDGMFLLAQLYINLLQDMYTPNEALETLQVFQKQRQGPGEDGRVEMLAHAYKQTMERINQQGSKANMLAMKVMSWVTYAKRELTKLELLHAVATKVGMSTIRQGDMMDIDDVLSKCSGLIVIDEKSDVIRTVHYTLQEYLELTLLDWFPDAKIDITKTCLIYNSLELFTSGPCEADEDFENRLQEYPLYQYTAQNWGWYAREAPTLSAEVATFLQCDNLVEASSQAMLSIKLYSVYSRNKWDSQRYPKHIKGLHVAAHFGLSEVLEMLLAAQIPNQPDSYRRTPLWYATNSGMIDAVTVLLKDQRVDPDFRDNEGRTALSLAAEKGYEAIVKQLLDTDRVDLESIDDKHGQTSLSWAGENGHEAVMKLLISKGANVDSCDNNGNTVLSLAAEKSLLPVVELLIGRGACVNFASDDGCTPLSWAAEQGAIEAVKLLIGNGACVKSASKTGDTPLSGAAEYGHGEIVELLVENGAHTESVDEEGRTPLSRAAGNGFLLVVELLLEHGANVDSADNKGRTPLSRAAGNGFLPVVELLLEHGANVDSADNKGRTPLSRAAGNGLLPVVELLLEHGANVQSADKKPWTPLRWAIENGHNIVAWLLHREMRGWNDETCKKTDHFQEI